MDDISRLLQEAKPLYFARKRRNIVRRFLRRRLKYWYPSGIPPCFFYCIIPAGRMQSLGFRNFFDFLQCRLVFLQRVWYNK